MPLDMELVIQIFNALFLATSLVSLDPFFVAWKQREKSLDYFKYYLGMLENVHSSSRPSTLSKVDQTDLTNHMLVEPGTFTRDTTNELRKMAHSVLKKEG